MGSSGPRLRGRRREPSEPVHYDAKARLGRRLRALDQNEVLPIGLDVEILQVGLREQLDGNIGFRS